MSIAEPVAAAELVYNLQKCQRTKDLISARNFFIQICKKGWEREKAIATSLVAAFLDCRNVHEAHHIFCGCCHDRNEQSWTSLIRGCTENGNPAYSLELFHHMQQDYVHPSVYTFVALLKACAQIRCVTQGQSVHREIIVRGLDMDRFIGNTTVVMHAKCGSIMEAKYVFRKLSNPNVVSWNALITGYIEHGCEPDARSCLEQMEALGVLPDAVTFSCLLRVCSSSGDIENGFQVHARIVCKGFEGNDSITVNLVSMYAKCGLNIDAKAVLLLAVHQNLILWTALIAGTVECGLHEAALKYLEEMQAFGIPPDDTTLLCCLKACSSLVHISEGQDLHSAIVMKGLETSIFLVNTLLDLYSKCGFFAEAHHVFETMPSKTVVSWNVLITGYSEHGCHRDALNYLYLMLDGGFLPDASTFNCTLKACSSSGMINQGKKIYISVLKQGLDTDQLLGNVLVDMYVKCGSISEARKVFDKLPTRNIVSWNTILCGYVEHEHHTDALRCLEEMQCKDIQLDTTSFIFFIKACGSIESALKGRMLHIEIAKKGLEREPFIMNGLLGMYLKWGHFTDAHELFRSLPKHNVAQWCTLIAGYIYQGQAEEVLKCIEEMQAEGIQKNIVAYACIFKACGIVGSMDIGQVMHSEVVKMGLDECAVCSSENYLPRNRMFHLPIASMEATNFVLENVLVDMYCKCGNVSDAYEVVANAGPLDDIVSWNSVIAGYARQGQRECVLKLFNEMIAEGMTPNHITCLGLLSVCSHTGLLDMFMICFKTMKTEHGLAPTISHFNCMIDMLARAGQIDAAVLALEKMPHQPSLATWCTILGACYKCGNVELGTYAFESALKLTKCSAALFIVMSNICTDVELLWAQS